MPHKDKKIKGRQDMDKRRRPPGAAKHPPPKVRGRKTKK